MECDGDDDDDNDLPERDWEHEKTLLEAAEQEISSSCVIGWRHVCKL